MFSWKFTRYSLPILWIALLSAVSLVAQTTAADSAGAGQTSVSGSITNTNGNPVEDAEVEVYPADVLPGLGEELPHFRAKTGADGAYKIDAVPPGFYYGGAGAEGYISQVYSSRGAGRRTQIAVRSGQPVKGIDIVLDQPGRISGTVRDEEGRPIAGAQVHAGRSSYRSGQKTMEKGVPAQTDENGGYTIEVRPGRLYVLAKHEADRLAIAKGEVAPDPATKARPAPTFYPGVTVLESAAAIDVRSGQQLEGIDVEIQSEPVYNIRGVAVDESGDPVTGLKLALEPPDLGSIQSGVRNIATIGEDGAFLFTGLFPGDYVLLMLPDFPDPETEPDAKYVDPGLDGRLPVTVINHDLEDVEFRMLPRPELHVTVAVEDGSDLPWDPEAESIFDRPQLLFHDGTVIIAGAPLDQNGSGDVIGLTQSRYRLEVQPMPEGAFVKSVVLNGQNISGRRVDLRNGGGGTLQVTLSKAGGEATGVARDEDGNLLSGVMVTLQAEHPWEGTTGRRASYTDQHGVYRFTGLRPDTYSVAAWDVELDFGLLGVPSFVRPFQEQMERFVVREGATASSDLTAIPAADVARAMQNVP